MGAYETISVDPVTPRVGAVVSGVDLGGPLGNQQFQEIHDALMRHEVLFFRDQQMSLDQHKAFGARFGELDVHPGSPGPEGHPEILIIHADENSKRVAGEAWHSDVSCLPEPPMGSILHQHDVPPACGGRTHHASAGAAYDALSEPMKQVLAPLTAIHSGDHVYRGRYAHQGVEDRDEVYPEARHPIVRTHPVTGRKSIFVNETFTTRIPELKPKESRALLDFLTSHIVKPEFQVRFKWAENSVAFWDNRAVQHHA
ncbi:MAG: TauD/TfdA family dioxygenase, partial [Alphaproteobacteria bacterium]